jgi:hypothetical protein
MGGWNYFDSELFNIYYLCLLVPGYFSSLLIIQQIPVSDALLLLVVEIHSAGRNAGYTQPLRCVAST